MTTLKVSPNAFKYPQTRGKLIVTGWVATVTLHNHLLTAVLHNAASTQPIATTPTLPATQTTTERITHDPTDTSAKNTQDPSTTLLGIVDATPATLGGSAPHPSSPSKQLSIASVPDTLPRRTRVREWLSGLNRAERDRLKRLPTQESERYDERNTLNKTVGEMQRGYQGRGRLRLNSTYGGVSFRHPVMLTY
jgi:hypothetical protein